MDGLLGRLSFRSSGAFFSRVILCGFVLCSASTGLAAVTDDGEDYVSYDSIIRNLQNQSDGYGSGYGSSSRARMRAMAPQTNPLDSVLIHAGVGYASLVETISFANGERLYLNQKGFQAALGIDLFSEHWMAEGTARSFADNEETTTRVQLKEFELKLIYKKRLPGQLGIRAGGGLSGRYMTFFKPEGQIEYTTPSSVAVVGMDFFMNDNVSLGLDLAGRQAMIGETVDRSSFDATLRLDTHF